MQLPSLTIIAQNNPSHHVYFLVCRQLRNGLMTKPGLFSNEFPIARIMCTLEKTLASGSTSMLQGSCISNQSTGNYNDSCSEIHTQRQSLLSVHLLSSTRSSVTAMLWTWATWAKTSRCFSLREAVHLAVPKVYGKHSNPQFWKLACCQLRVGSRGPWHG